MTNRGFVWRRPWVQCVLILQSAFLICSAKKSSIGKWRNYKSNSVFLSCGEVCAVWLEWSRPWVHWVFVPVQLDCYDIAVWYRGLWCFSAINEDAGCILGHHGRIPDGCQLSCQTHFVCWRSTDAKDEWWNENLSKATVKSKSQAFCHVNGWTHQAIMIAVGFCAIREDTLNCSLIQANVVKS